MNQKIKIKKKFHSIIILVIVFAVYLTLSNAAINEKQMIYADGHNLYVSHRLAQGLKLYEDVQALYGPAFYLIGAGLMNLGLTFAGLKVFMLSISVASGIFIFLITKKSFNNVGAALLATAIYMFTPLHYGMAPVFHPDSIAILFCLVTLYLILVKNNLFYIIAAIFATTAVFTKIIAIPLVCAIMVYFLINKIKSGLFYIIPFFLIIIPLIVYITSFANSNDNTKIALDLLLKDTDFPGPILRDIGWIEGSLIIIGIIGLLAYTKEVKTYSVLLIVSLSTVLVFATILTPGVGAHEFNWVEPFVAIFAAYAIFQVRNNLRVKQWKIGKMISILFVSLIFIQSAIFIWPDRERISDWDGEGRFKLLNEITEEHRILLEEHSSKGDVVVASPMAAFKTERILPLDNTFPDMLEFKYEYGYETANQEISKLRQMVENKEIKILINYMNEDNLNKILFFPYYLDSFNDTIAENYDQFKKGEFTYYLPKT